MTGKIIKAIAGFYYVHTAESGIYMCRARGLFRLTGVNPLVGDDAEFEVTDPKDMEGNITAILPRRSELTRPSVANVDLALAVFAVKDPAVNSLMLDKLLLSFRVRQIPVTLVLNKSDLAVNTEQAEALLMPYRGAGCRNVTISTRTGEGLKELAACFEGRTAVLAGPSGVGKSSLINCFCPDADREVGTVSRKLMRGKNTTRETALFPCGNGGYLVDTPGFTYVFLPDIASEDLQYYYPEFADCIGKCRFQGCVHRAEPDCAVKEAVAAKAIHPDRYKTYLSIYDEIKEREARRY